MARETSTIFLPIRTSDNPTRFYRLLPQQKLNITWTLGNDGVRYTHHILNQSLQCRKLTSSMHYSAHPLFQQEFGRVCGEASGQKALSWRRRCSHRHGHIMLMEGYESEIRH
jgi:hypothetical protein